MQTITTKYLGPTDYKGSRFKATHTGGFASVTLPYDYALSPELNHLAAANALSDKLNWDGQYVGGHTKDGMVWVNSNPMYTFKS